jgi:hypothetical protein
MPTDLGRMTALGSALTAMLDNRNQSLTAYRLFQVGVDSIERFSSLHVSGNHDHRNLTQHRVLGAKLQSFLVTLATTVTSSIGSIGLGTCI